MSTNYGDLFPSVMGAIFTTWGLTGVIRRKITVRTRMGNRTFIGSEAVRQSLPIIGIGLFLIALGVVFFATKLHQ